MGLNDGELHRHDSHDKHGKTELTLRVHLKAPGAYTCSGCKMPGLDPCLKCICENCDFHLHKACYQAERDFSVLSWEFLECKKFEYHENPPVTDHCRDIPYCDACGLDIKGFRYRCVDHPYNPHDLHPTCSQLTKRDKRQDENGLIYQLQDDVKSKCLHCRKRYPVEECPGFTGLKWVCTKRDLAFPFCFTGRKRCYHLKCMNQIQSNTGATKISKDPELEYFNGGITKCFTDLLTIILDSI